MSSAYSLHFMVEHTELLCRMQQHKTSLCSDCRKVKNSLKNCKPWVQATILQQTLMKIMPSDECSSDQSVDEIGIGLRPDENVICARRGIFDQARGSANYFVKQEAFNKGDSLRLCKSFGASGALLKTLAAKIMRCKCLVTYDNDFLTWQLNSDVRYLAL